MKASKRLKQFCDESAIKNGGSVKLSSWPAKNGDPTIKGFSEKSIYQSVDPYVSTH